ncbi:MAG: hypothetical protein P8X58_08730 [Syntrophobacterales bacterium]
MEASLQDNELKPTPGNYQLTRFNATRHGILSRHTVLPWEPSEEYEELHLALKKEYVPVGPTEEHLVEEIAGIIWRKRRLRLAESGAFRDRFCQVITQVNTDILRSGLPGLRQPPLGDDKGNEKIITMNPEEAGSELQEAQETLQVVHEGQELLRERGTPKYPVVLEKLPPKVRAWWKESVENKKYEPRAAGLLKFLDEEVAPYYSNRVALLSHRNDIMAQAQGESVDTEKLERLIRYEVFLDRKLERMLAMLLKLQALRRTQEPASG